MQPANLVERTFKLTDSSNSRNRRDFLTGKSTPAGNLAADRPTPSAPTSGHTVRLSQRAMACDFSVIMNAGVRKSRIEDASHALDLVSELERQMSVYIEDSEISRLNARAGSQAVQVEPGLFALLLEAERISQMTERAFDPTSGPLIALWRSCRSENRIPSQDEIRTALRSVGIRHVQFNAANRTIQFDHADVEVNLGGIGKGYALDREAEWLNEQELSSFLLHGGHSSLKACGDHNGAGGWPVGIGNPLFTSKRLGTVVVTDCAMATSGSNIQFFRHGGKKYGHILDPRTGWPVETMLSVTVLAPTATLADALSTAFYVLGTEATIEFCERRPDIGAILIPTPKGRDLTAIAIGLAQSKLFLDSDQVSLVLH